MSSFSHFFGPTFELQVLAVFLLAWAAVFVIAGLASLFRHVVPWLTEFIIVDIMNVRDRLELTPHPYVRARLIYKLRSLTKNRVNEGQVSKALEILEVREMPGSFAEDTISETFGKWVAAEFERLRGRKDRVRFVERVRRLVRHQELERAPPRAASEPDA